MLKERSPGTLEKLEISELISSSQSPHPPAFVPLRTDLDMRMKGSLKHLFYLNEGPWRWKVGIQAAFAIGLPIAFFTLLGNQSLGLVTSLGGFTALFCTSMPRKDKLRILPMVALGIILASALGVLSSGSILLSLLCLIVVATLACIFAFGKNLNPPGPVFFVLVAAVSGFIADRSNPEDFSIGIFQIPLMVALGAFFAYLVVISPLLFPRMRKKEKILKPKPFYSSGFSWSAEQTSKTVKIVLGVAIAGSLAMLMDSSRSYWTVIPVLAILQGGLNRKHTTIRAVHRTLGTTLGIFAFALIAYFEPKGIALVLIIMLLQFLTEMVVTKNYGLALLFITPLALSIATAVSTEDPFFTIRERLIDTFIGSAIALAIFFIAEGIQARRNIHKTE